MTMPGSFGDRIKRRSPHTGHRVRLLSSYFRYADHRMLFGVARLFGDRIELASWELTGRKTRSIKLEHIAEMDYHLLKDGSNLSLVLDSGEVLNLRLPEAHVWREFFENWLRYDILPSAKLMGDADKALTLSG